MVEVVCFGQQSKTKRWKNCMLAENRHKIKIIAVRDSNGRFCKSEMTHSLHKFNYCHKSDRFFCLCVHVSAINFVFFCHSQSEHLYNTFESQDVNDLFKKKNI